ncbi:MAG: septal ring lytic transglycosylase RlpA family protein [Parafilimonas sp.]
MKNNSFSIFAGLILLSVLFSSCSRYITETGIASYYGGQFNHRQTASGKKFNKHHLTAAHKTLPFGTKVIVINLTNHERVKVRITDRGPFVNGRIIDLSEKAAKKIDMLQQGIAQVELKYRKKK